LGLSSLSAIFQLQLLNVLGEENLGSWTVI